MDVLVTGSRLVTGNTTGCIGHRQSVGDWEHHWMYWSQAAGWCLGAPVDVLVTGSRLVSGNISGCIGHRQSVGDGEHQCLLSENVCVYHSTH